MKNRDKMTSANKIVLPKEEWTASSDRVYKMASIIAKWTAHNPEMRGLHDMEFTVFDLQLACQAMRYVAENATEECSVIPPPADPYKRK